MIEVAARYTSAAFGARRCWKMLRLPGEREPDWKHRLLEILHAVTRAEEKRKNERMKQRIGQVRAETKDIYDKMQELVTGSPPAKSESLVAPPAGDSSEHLQDEIFVRGVGDPRNDPRNAYSLWGLPSVEEYVGLLAEEIIQLREQRHPHRGELCLEYREADRERREARQEWYRLIRETPPFCSASEDLKWQTIEEIRAEKRPRPAERPMLERKREMKKKMKARRFVSRNR